MPGLEVPKNCLGRVPRAMVGSGWTDRGIWAWFGGPGGLGLGVSGVSWPRWGWGEGGWGQATEQSLGGFGLRSGEKGAGLGLGAPGELQGGAAPRSSAEAFPALPTAPVQSS